MIGRVRDAHRAADKMNGLDCPRRDLLADRIRDALEARRKMDESPRLAVALAPLGLFDRDAKRARRE